MTLREDLRRTTLENQTVEAETKKIIEACKKAADYGCDGIEINLSFENEFDVAKNLTNKYCSLSVERLNEEERLYFISWD